jgi:glycosyltransferase involved in cell wall biosynthesis
MTPASLSVIIPSYNSGPLVTQAVDSVLAQTVPASDVIVVDDGSADDTAARLLPYPAHVRYVRQENQGVSAARNHGLRLAQGELVAFLDADDVWHPRKVELQLEAFKRHPELDLIGTRTFEWPADQFPNLDISQPRLTAIDWEQLVVKNRLTTSSVVVRRRALDRAGLFDTDLQGPEDRDLWLRIARHSAMANLELKLTGYRNVEGSVSKQIERCRNGMLQILGKIDQQRGWNGRWLLRRKAYSYVNHSCAYLYGAAGRYPNALASSLSSILWYPLPYTCSEAMHSWERPRRMLVAFLRWLRLKAADPPAAEPR